MDGFKFWGTDRASGTGRAAEGTGGHVRQNAETLSKRNGITPAMMTDSCHGSSVIVALSRIRRFLWVLSGPENQKR